MKIEYYAYFAYQLLVFAFLMGCSNYTFEEDVESTDDVVVSAESSDDGSSTDSRGTSDVESIDGFVKFTGAKSVTLKDASYGNDASMEVKLSDDFFMARSEVTMGEYAKLMGGNVTESQKNLPQVEVNYYDAVLFANAKSKSEGLDTVYTYTGSQMSPSGNCVFLEGLSVRYDVFGYRLPTEAEWVYVAQKFWDVKNSWTADNSSYEIHQVCIEPSSGDSSVKVVDDADVVCDMAGNVTEWVDGWLVDYKDTSLVNFVGGEIPNSFGESIIKGGNYQSLPDEINIGKRRDTYAVARSSMADYVGFRLAIGKIKNPLWLDASGTAKTVLVDLLASLETVQEFLQSSKAKLVFRNDVTGNLMYVDYYRSAPVAVEIKSGIDAYHPDISPDGNFVAFSTGLESARGQSDVYVCRLDSACSGKVRLPVESAAIPRFRVLESGDTVLVYVSNGADNKNSQEWMSYSTWQVPFAGGHFGTPQKLFNGSFNGGVTDDFAVTGFKLLRVAKRNASGDMDYDVWYNGEQACNVSLSNNGSGRTLFLDFGGSTGRNFVGKKYRAHEQILVLDANGKLVDAVASPANFSFDHSEWVNGKNVAVATLSDNDGAHKKIVLIDMETKAILEVAGSENLFHPVMWVENLQLPVNSSSSSSSGPSEEFVSSSLGLSSSSEEVASSSSLPYTLNLKSDSAGVYIYSTNTTDLHNSIVRYKMELLWQYADSANVVVMGSSRPLNGVFPKLLSNQFLAVNLCMAASTIHMSKDFLMKYVFPHYKKMRYLVVSLDLDFWWKDATKDNWFHDGSDAKAMSYKGFVYDKNHNYWVGEPDITPLYEASKKAPRTTLARLDSMIEQRGQLQTECAPSSSWTSGLGNAQLDPSQQALDASMNALKTIIEESAKRKVKVIGTIFPMSPEFKKSEYYGYYGMRRSIAESLISELEEMSSTYSNFVLFDENKGGEHDYKGGMNADAQHLCDEGGKLYTSRLDSLLLELDKN
ncbi:MAG: TIGR02171 family protein [Fibrobacter sp.]|nr:TIGR02171 family protein [Fibrobacter sp.]